jgi:serine/threonine protein kinase
MNSSGLHIQIHQHGGKQIAEGVFGCIFSPPLQCLNKNAKPPKDKLGKLTDYGDIKNEIIAAKYLRQFSTSSQYCILPEIESICTPDIEGAEQKHLLDNCHSLQENKNKPHFQFTLEYGGVTLKKTLLTVNPSLKTIPFFSLMRQLLEIGAFLVVHGFIHNDIHGNNIVLDDSFKPRLIDFGRAYIHDIIKHNLIEELSADYNPNLGQIAPETTAEHGIRENIPLATILDDMKKRKPAIEWVEKLLGVSRTEQVNEFKQFWLHSKAAQTKDWVALYKLYWPVVDSWAIGHNIIQILRRMYISEDFSKNNEWVQKQGIVKQVLRGLLHTSPKLRIDCLQALAIYDPMNEMVSSPTGSLWLERKQTQH